MENQLVEAREWEMGELTTKERPEGVWSHGPWWLDTQFQTFVKIHRNVHYKE